jgi:hypothetical protein
MSWSRRFFDPIELSDGRRLVTLKDAAEYITGLSASEHDLPHWRAAVAALILSAEHGESSADPMLARIAMIHALIHGQPKPAPTPAEEGGQEVQARPMITFRLRGAPLRNREGKFALKYFRVDGRPVTRGRKSML